MKLKITTCYLFLSLFLVAQFVVAQDQANRTSLQKNENVYNLSAGGTNLRIEFCTSSMVRIRASWNNKFAENEPWMVTRYQWPAVPVQTAEEGNTITLKSDQLRVKLSKSPLLVEIYNAEGKLLSSEKLAGGNGGIKKDRDTVACRKQLLPNEHFFGFGERMDFLDQRGKLVKLNVGRGTGRPHEVGAYNVLEANYCPVPFFMSTQGYAIFMHNSYATEWDMGSTDPASYAFKAAGGELDYYFIYGPKFPAMIDQYTSLTGKAPLMPLFALGLQVGTYSGGTWGFEHLTSDRYVIELVKRFRQMGIPIDVLHLDSTWRLFGKNGGKGATTFEWRETFKDPKGMFDSLYAMHINLAGVHIRPRFDNGNKLNLLDQAREKGFTYLEDNNPGEFVNFFDQKAVDWWFENGVKNAAALGARFVKTDEGSAFGHVANESEKVGPTGDEIRKLHNIFPLAYAKAPYEKFQQYNGIRGMNHTREGYAGIQRYPFIFAGDWPSEWQYFGPVIKAGLNIGLSGVGNWAHCMGGFEHNADPELYIRWCQFGLLSPVAHLFGMDHPGYKEPWNYGEEALKIFKQYDQMRYSLLPYLYSHSYEMHQTGMPLMRALVLEYQDDINTYDVADQYLLGNSMLVCPVTTKAAKTRVVYLPEGTWYDYWTGKQYTGKDHHNVVTPLDKLPIFIKEGAIIPRQKVVQYVGEKKIDTLDLEIYPSANSTFTLYDDDGKSLDYQKGIYALTAIKATQDAGNVRVQVQAPKGQYVVPERSYLIKVRMPVAPASVGAAGKKMTGATSLATLKSSKKAGWYFDANEQWLYVQPAGNSKKDINIEIIK